MLPLEASFAWTSWLAVQGMLLTCVLLMLSILRWFSSSQLYQETEKRLKMSQRKDYYKVCSGSLGLRS
jgi:hypothetical protein